MASRMPIEDIAVYAVRRAMEAGATEAEAFVMHVRGFEAQAENNRLVGGEVLDEAGVAIRAVVGKRVGFSYASSLELDEVAKAAREAVKAARAAPEDPQWPGLPEPSEMYPEPEGMYDSAIARTKPENIVENLSEMLETALEDKRVTVYRAGYGYKIVRRAIASTSGVYRIDVGTFAYGYIGVVAREGDVVTPVVFEEEVERVSMPSPELLAKRAVEKATRSFKTWKPDSPMELTVVLSSNAFAELLEHTVIYALSGEQFVRGVSPYAGKIGEQVMSEKLTIVDDGLLRQGMNTWRFDGEGVAMQRTVLVEKGVLQTPYYDHYWGRRAGAASTGNCVRLSYASKPKIGATNIVVDKGDSDIDDLLEGKVLLVEALQGAHSSNPVTGEYSVLAAPAWLVVNGEEYYLAKGVMLAGNIYEELMRNVEAIGSWQETVPYMTFYKVPWIRIRGVKATPQR